MCYINFKNQKKPKVNVGRFEQTQQQNAAKYLEMGLKKALLYKLLSTKNKQICRFHKTSS